MRRNQTESVMGNQNYSDLDRKRIMDEIQLCLLRFEDPGPYRCDGMALYEGIFNILDEDRCDEGK